MLRTFLSGVCALIGFSGLLGCEAMGAAPRANYAKVVAVEDGVGGRGPTAVVSYQVPATDREARAAELVAAAARRVTPRLLGEAASCGGDGVSRPNPASAPTAPFVWRTGRR